MIYCHQNLALLTVMREKQIRLLPIENLFFIDLHAWDKLL